MKNLTKIAGVGTSKFSRNSGVATDMLAASAVREALADAGLRASDIDGVVAYSSGARAEEVIVPMGLPDVKFSASVHLGGASGVSSLQVAASAIIAGLATHVLIFIARNGSSESRIARRLGAILPSPHFREHLEFPHGLSTPAQYYSMICRRHMHEFGTTRADLGAVALTMRENAQLNPNAQMYGRTLTMDQYLHSRPIAEPYLLADCCLETDGAVAIVLSGAERTGDGKTPVLLAGVAEGRPDPGDDLSNRQPFFDAGLTKAAPRAFAMAGLNCDDLDIAMIYDCFTFELIHQLEELGVCARGEGGPYVSAGNIGRSGRLPVNTHGGLLSEGHLGGLGHIVEAVRQLRHSAGDRQIRNAEVAAVTGWGDFGDGSLALLTKGA